MLLHEHLLLCSTCTYLVHCTSLIDYFVCILVYFHELIVIRVHFHPNRCDSVLDLDFQLFVRYECHRLLLYWEFAAKRNSENQFSIKFQFSLKWPFIRLEYLILNIGNVLKLINKKNYSAVKLVLLYLHFA